MTTFEWCMTGIALVGLFWLWFLARTVNNHGWSIWTELHAINHYLRDDRERAQQARS